MCNFFVFVIRSLDYGMQMYRSFTGIHSIQRYLPVTTELIIVNVACLIHEDAGRGTRRQFKIEIVSDLYKT